MQGGGGRQEPPDFLHTEDGGEMVGGLRAQERQRGPVALEDVLIEEANTAVADAHGGWREAVDVFAVKDPRRKQRGFQDKDYSNRDNCGSPVFSRRCC